MSNLNEVYVIIEDVQCEGSNIVSVHQFKTDAAYEAERLAAEHRYAGEWNKWNGHVSDVVRIQNRDVTFIVKAFEVQT